MRFPAHLQANVHTPTSSPATEGKESEEANDEKGPQCAQDSQSTPVVARNRLKLET